MITLPHRFRTSALTEKCSTRFRSIALTMSLLIGCDQPRSKMDPQALNAFANEYTAAWCSQTPSRVAAHFAEDGSLTINDGEASVGRDAIATAAQSFMTAFPDMIVLMDSLVDMGDQYEYHWTLIGTNTGPGGTGRTVHISGYEEWTLSNDRLIQRSLGHFDAEEYARQLNG